MGYSKEAFMALREFEADEAEPAYPFGPHDYDADMAEERRAYQRFGFEMLESDEDPAF